MRASYTRTRVTATSAASHSQSIRRARAKATRPPRAGPPPSTSEEVAGRRIVGPQLQDGDLDGRAGEQPEGGDGGEARAARQKEAGSDERPECPGADGDRLDFQSPVPKTWRRDAAHARSSRSGATPGGAFLGGREARREATEDRAGVHPTTARGRSLQSGRRLVRRNAKRNADAGERRDEPGEVERVARLRARSTNHARSENGPRFFRDRFRAPRGSPSETSVPARKAEPPANTGRESARTREAVRRRCRPPVRTIGQRGRPSGRSSRRRPERSAAAAPIPPPPNGPARSERRSRGADGRPRVSPHRASRPTEAAPSGPRESRRCRARTARGRGPGSALRAGRPKSRRRGRSAASRGSSSVLSRLHLSHARRTCWNAGYSSGSFRSPGCSRKPHESGTRSRARGRTPAFSTGSRAAPVRTGARLRRVEAAPASSLLLSGSVNPSRRAPSRN